jgi:hypothetical protein
MKLWIARDKDNTLSLYKEKPVIHCDSYYDTKEYYEEEMFLDKSCFPEVTFENSPQEVELKLVKDVL